MHSVMANWHGSDNRAAGQLGHQINSRPSDQQTMSSLPSPSPQEEAARLLGSPPADPDAGRRRDFTQAHTIYTIDDASTTEIDDGLSLERLPDGRTKVGGAAGCRRCCLC